MRVLVTGGAGYIGAHALVALEAAGCTAIALDDLSRGVPEQVADASRVVGRELPLIVQDAGDAAELAAVLRAERIDGVLHLAAGKSVTESLADPAGYERQNVGVTAAVAEACKAAGVRKLVFASTAAVYGEAVEMPVSEQAPISALSPYADTKARAERLLEAAFSGFGSVASVRFFNVCGAHVSGLLGERVDVPTNLLPILLRALKSERPTATVFGTDYATPDGSCVRDYVHVMDVASAVVGVLLGLSGGPSRAVFNVGTGRGASVREVIAAVEAASGRKLVVIDGARREGDPAMSVADARAIREALGWRAAYGLAEMAASAWAYESRSAASKPA